MGFGKFLIGGICAVGAVVAAPVVLPTVGWAMAGSLATGAVGTTVGLGLATTSTTTLAVGAGTVAGIAGTAAAGAHENRTKKIEELQKELKNAGSDSAVKQKVIEKLHLEISQTKKELEAEKGKVDKNEAKIAELEKQLNDLMDLANNEAA